MSTYSDHEQRLLDQQTGEEMDRQAQRREAKASNLRNVIERILGNARECKHTANNVHVHRQLIGELRAALADFPAETKAPTDYERRSALIAEAARPVAGFHDARHYAFKTAVAEEAMTRLWKATFIDPLPEKTSGEPT